MKFSFKRFLNLARLFFAEHWKAIVTYFLSYIIIMTLVFSSLYKILEMMNGDKNQAAQTVVFQMADFVVIILSYVLLFVLLQKILKRRYHNTNTSITYFQLPVSTLEKWVFDYLIIGAGFCLLNFAIMNGMHSAFAKVLHNLNPELSTNTPSLHITSGIGFSIFSFVLISIWIVFIDFMKNDSKKWNWHSLSLKATSAFLFSSWCFDMLFFRLPDIKSGVAPVRFPFQTLKIPNPKASWEPYSIASSLSLEQINVFIILPIILCVGMIYFFKIKEYEV